MTYLTSFFSGRTLYLILAVLIVFFFSKRKDRYTSPGDLFEAQSWDLDDVLLYLIFLVCSFVITGTLFKGLTAIAYVFWGSVAVMLYCFFRFKLKQSFLALGLSKKNFWWNAIYGIRVMLYFEIIFYGWLSLVPMPEEVLHIASESLGLLSLYQGSLYILVIVFISYLLLPSFLEEFIFRGLLYSPLRKKVGKWGAMFLTSTIFALMHGELVSGLALLLAYMYEQRRSLVPCIAAHTLFNLRHQLNAIYMNNFFAPGYAVDAHSFVKVMFVIMLAALLLIMLIERMIKRPVHVNI